MQLLPQHTVCLTHGLFNENLLTWLSIWFLSIIATGFIFLSTSQFKREAGQAEIDMCWLLSNIRADSIINTQPMRDSVTL